LPAVICAAHVTCGRTLKENWKVKRTCHVFEVTKTDFSLSEEFQSLEMLNMKNFSCLWLKQFVFFIFKKWS